MLKVRAKSWQFLQFDSLFWRLLARYVMDIWR